MSISTTTSNAATSDQSRLTYTGYAEANNYVMMYDGEELVGFTIADASGRFRIVSDRLDDGPHVVTFTATDVAGNVSLPSDPRYVTIASSGDTPPKSQLEAPTEVHLSLNSDTGASSTDNITKNTLPMFQGHVAPGSWVELVVDGVKGHFASPVDAQGNWLARGNVLSEGVHTISVIEHDSFGNVSAPSTPTELIIDLTAALKPVITLVAHGDDGSIDGQPLIHTSTPVFTGKTEAGAEVGLYENTSNGSAVKIGRTVADSNGDWSFTSTAYPDGQHSVAVSVTDLAGNYVESDNLVFNIDTNAPHLGSDSGLSGDRVTNVVNPIVFGKAGAGASVVLYDGVNVVGNAVADASGNWRIVTNTLSDGQHSLVAQANDAQGHALPASGALVLTIDTKGPQTASSAPVLDVRDDHGISALDQITNTGTLAVVGTGEVNTTVRVYVDGVEQKTKAHVGNAGTWGSMLYGLSDGVHRVSVTTEDAAGNVGPMSADGIITVDTKGPAAPAAPLLVALSDNGASPNGDISNVAAPQLSGSTEAGATVALYDGAKRVGSAVADDHGNWRITASALADGTHSLTVTATDVAGNISDASAALSLTVDTKPPAPSAPDLLTASDDGVSTGDNLTSVATPTITGNAEFGATVLLFDGGAQIGKAVANSSGVWSITTETLANGQHSLTTTVTDLAGNVSAPSAALLLTIAPKAAAIGTPALDPLPDGGNSSSDGVTNLTTPHLTGTAQAGATVIVYDGATQIGSAVANDLGKWSVTSSVLADGPHSLTATATDAFGNTSTASAGLSLTIDTTPPPPPSAPDLLTASDNGFSTSDNITSLATPTITGKAGAGDTVLLFDDGIQIGEAVANSSGVWSITTGALADGQHHLSAAVTDQAGNVSLPSTELLLTIDPQATVITAPTLDPLSDSGRSQSDGITNLTTPHLTGKAQAGSTVIVYDGKTQVGSTVADSDGNWSLATKALAAGTHSLTATATDAASKVSTVTPALVVTVDNKAAAAPTTLDLATAADSGASTTDNLTAIAAPVVSGKAEANASVSLYDGATLLGTAIADGKGAWQITSSVSLADGVHKLTATATDVAGNISAASTALAVTVDTKAAAPTALDLATASDKGASATDNLTNLPTPTITGKAQAGSTVLLFDGATQIGKAVANSSGVWSVTSGKLADGDHQLTATATDVAGNVSLASDALLVTIDTKAPDAAAAPLLNILSDSGASHSDHITNITVPTVGGATSAGFAVTLYDGGIQVGTTVADENGLWSITSKALAAGAHNLTVKLTDLAGNVSAASAALALTIDNKAPVAPTTLDLPTAYDAGTSNADNKTSITTPVVTGKAEANASVSLYDGATLLGTGTADSKGAWQITSTVSLSNGAHNLTAKATDIAGNTSAASSALKLTIDPAATGLTLTGTAALDSFLLNEQAGAIKVVGFSSAAGDQLVLSHAFNGLTLDSAADVLALSHVVGKDTVIDLGAGHTVTLVGVAALAGHDIAFIG